VEAMIGFMYTVDYRDVPKDDPDALLFHVKLFALADKYDVWRLRQVTTSKFTKAVPGTSYSLLPSAIEAAFTTTPSNVGGLREATVSAAHTYLTLLKGEKEFQDMMDRNGEFGRALMLKVMTELERIPNTAGMTCFVCKRGNCGLKFMMNTYSKMYDGRYYTRGATNPESHSGFVWSHCPACVEICKAQRPDKSPFADDSWMKYSCQESTCRVELVCSHDGIKEIPQSGLKLRCPVITTHPQLTMIGPA
jgi:hypothetical protein